MMTPEWYFDKLVDLIYDELNVDIDCDTEIETKLIKLIKEIQDDAGTTKST